MNELPVLILGQGMAGSCLALELLGRGLPFHVVDHPTLSMSSKVAAGILNTLIFRYYTLSWRAVDYLDFSKHFYRQFQQKQHCRILHEVPLLRIFGQDEQAMWEKKASTSPFDHFMQKEPIASLAGAELPFGAGVVQAAAWLDTAAFVAKVRELLSARGLISEFRWSHNQIESRDGVYMFLEKAYSKVVFCEGYRAVDNPWLTFIPFRPVKGDVLLVRIPGFRTEYILNKNFFLVPLGDEMFRLGSTYVWEFTDEVPRPEMAEKLLQQLRTVISQPVEVVQHTAGVRPAMADRRPVVGALPAVGNMFVFNGLGSRGGLLAPPLARYLAELMEGKSGIDAEVDPARFPFRPV
ncbi:MAG: FAD-binding oxidoreductase [Bacteroidetes bacterium]|nr:FAD-binding oxidoreductase [Bacteroidota bacterium]